MFSLCGGDREKLTEMGADITYTKLCNRLPLVLLGLYLLENNTIVPHTGNETIRSKMPHEENTTQSNWKKMTKYPSSNMYFKISISSKLHFVTFPIS